MLLYFLQRKFVERNLIGRSMHIVMGVWYIIGIIGIEIQNDEWFDLVYSPPT